MKSLFEKVFSNGAFKFTIPGCRRSQNLLTVTHHKFGLSPWRKKQVFGDENQAKIIH